MVFFRIPSKIDLGLEALEDSEGFLPLNILNGLDKRLCELVGDCVANWFE